MNWKTAMQWIKGILSGAGVVAGIAAIASSVSFGRTLADYLVGSAPGTYGGIQSQEAQALSDALGAGLIFYDSFRLLLLCAGIAMLCFFGIVLVDTLRQAPVDVLVDSEGVDTLRRRAAHAAARLARRLDPEGNAAVVHEQEVLPGGERESLEFTVVKEAPQEELVSPERYT